MKSVVGIVLCLALAADALKVVKQEPGVMDTVVDDTATQDAVQDSMKNSFGQSKLEPPCSKIECGEYECPTPFELKVDETCCGYCWAPDYECPTPFELKVDETCCGYC